MRIHTLSVALVTLTASMAIASTPSRSDDDEACTKAPKEQWLTTDQIKSKLVDAGFKVTKVEIEDGCAEAKVEDKEGETRELTLDPQTGAEADRKDD